MSPWHLKHALSLSTHARAHTVIETDAGKVVLITTRANLEMHQKLLVKYDQDRSTRYIRVSPV